MPGDQPRSEFSEDSNVLSWNGAGTQTPPRNVGLERCTQTLLKTTRDCKKIALQKQPTLAECAPRLQTGHWLGTQNCDFGAKGPAGTRFQARIVDQCTETRRLGDARPSKHHPRAREIDG